MSTHSGSARDQITSEPSKTSSTPGMGWVIIGFVLVCVAVAAVNIGGVSLTGGSHIAATPSSQG